jgi:hypothetical protein
MDKNVYFIFIRRVLIDYIYLEERSLSEISVNKLFSEYKIVLLICFDKL